MFIRIVNIVLALSALAIMSIAIYALLMAWMQ